MKLSNLRMRPKSFLEVKQFPESGPRLSFITPLPNSATELVDDFKPHTAVLKFEIREM